MKKIIQATCETVISQYSHDKNVLGIMLCGSVARNKSDQHSDIDIYILLKEKGKLARKNFIDNGIRVDIIFNSIFEANNYLTEEKTSFRKMTSHLLAHGVILFQRTTELKIMQLTANKNLNLKIKLSKEEILMHKYSIDDFWGEVQRDLKNNDYLAFGLDSHLLLSNILELFLKLHGCFSPQPNEMKLTLYQLDTKFSQQIENFYVTFIPKKKVIILSKLIKYIYEQSGGPLPDRWTLKN